MTSVAARKVRLMFYNVIHSVDMPNSTYVPLAFVLLEEYLNKHAKYVEVTRRDYLQDRRKEADSEDLCGCDILGFQLTYSNAHEVINIMKSIQHLENRPLVVLGGVLASSIAVELINSFSCIDIIVIGEGEETLLQLIQVVRVGARLEKIPGIVYRNDREEAVYNKGNTFVDFESLPIPKRKFLASELTDVVKRSCIRMQTARGCLGGCSFCMNSHKNRLETATKKVWRGLSPERVVAEIEYLYREFHVRIFHFIDPSFEDPGELGKERIEKIAKLLIDRDLRISFKANLRAETFTDDDTDLLLLLKKAGMDVVLLGIEGSTDDELRLFGKNTDIQTATRAYWRLKELDCFVVQPGFITLHPYSTVGSLRQSFEYLNQLGQSFSFNILKNALIPLRGTNMFDLMINDGLISNEEDILAVPEYQFVSEDVSRIHNVIQGLKVKFPVLIDLHRSIHDAHHVIYRSTNRTYMGMLSNLDIENVYKELRSIVNSVCDDLGERYYAFECYMLDLVERGWDLSAVENYAAETIIHDAPAFLKRIEQGVSTYVEVVRSRGYDSSILEFKSWGSYCQDNTRIGVRN